MINHTNLGLRYDYSPRSGGDDSILIVFVHGMGGSLHNFRHVQDVLSTEFSTMSVELPGHGRSSDIAVQWSLDSISNAVWRGIEEVRVGRLIYFVGHSLGCFIAARLATDHSQQVLGATMIEGALFHVGDLLKTPLRSCLMHPVWMARVGYALVTATVRPSDSYRRSLNDSAIAHLSLWPFLLPRLTRIAPSVAASFKEQGGSGARRLLRLASDVSIRDLYRLAPPNLNFIVGERDPLMSRTDLVTLSEIVEPRAVKKVSSAHWPQVEVPSEVAALISTNVVEVQRRKS